MLILDCYVFTGKAQIEKAWAMPDKMQDMLDLKPHPLVSKLCLGAFSNCSNFTNTLS